MPIPSFGQLALSRIALELGLSNSNLSLGNMSASVGFSSPHAVSDFFGYNPCPPYGGVYYDFCDGCNYYYKYHDGNCGHFDVLVESNSSICGCGSSYACRAYWWEACSLYSMPCWQMGYEDCGAVAN